MIEDTIVSSTLRAIFTANRRADASAALREFGLQELIEHEPTTTARLVFGLQGEMAATSNALSTLMVSRLRAGTAAGADAMLVLATDGIDGVGRNSIRAGLVSCGGVSIAGRDHTELLAPIAIDGDPTHVGIATLVVGDAGLEVRPLDGIDPGLLAWRIKGRGVVPRHVDDSSHTAAAWDDALVWGRTALSAELLGNARAALALAVDHARHRVQFGQPIGAFQAVKHRLADVLVAVEAAQSALDATLAEPSPLSAMVAKSMAGRAGRLAATNCLQVLGAIGFTFEHPFHHHQSRMIALDHLLGSADQLPGAIGREVLAAGRAPILVHLQDR